MSWGIKPVFFGHVTRVCVCRLGEGSGVRAVRLREGVLVAPEGGWKDRVYVVLIQEKSPEGVC